jgi:hypothetical protein
VLLVQMSVLKLIKIYCAMIFANVFSLNIISLLYLNKEYNANHLFFTSSYF